MFSFVYRSLGNAWFCVPTRACLSTAVLPRILDKALDTVSYSHGKNVTGQQA
jgi:hypothetical protein